MVKFVEFKSFSAAGALIASSAFIAIPAGADENPFQMTGLSSGYMVAGGHGGNHNKMKMMDTDGDGSVSKEEFMTYTEKKFDRKDTNGDGVLSADEMKHMKHNREGKSGEGKCGNKNNDS